MDDRPAAAEWAKVGMYELIQATARRLGPRVAAGEITAEYMKAELLRIGDEEFARIQAELRMETRIGGAMADQPNRDPWPGRDPLRPARGGSADGAANPRPNEDPLARHRGRPGQSPARGGYGRAGNPRPGQDPLQPPQR